MRILFITNGYPPQRWAGTETYTAGIAEEFQKRGMDVRVLCIGKWDEGSNYFNGTENTLYRSILVTRLNVNWKRSPDPFVYLYNNPVIADHLRQIIKDFHPQLVHVTSCETLSASVFPVVKDFGIPLILTLTDFWFLCPRINLLKSDGTICNGQTTAWQCLKCQVLHTKAYKWSSLLLPGNVVQRMMTKISQYRKITRQRGFRGMAGDMQKRKDYLLNMIKLPDVRITASNFVRDLFNKNQVSSILVRPYGHDLSWLIEYSGKTASNKLRLGYIGQISITKGVHILIEAYNHLDKDYQEKLQIYIYGNMAHDISYSKSLMDKVQGQNSIQFRGIYAHERSALVFSEIDILVVPSLWYDFPLVIYEAFATKTPVIASNLGGMAEAIEHNVNGLLFESGNINELQKQIVRFFDDPDLYERLRVGIPIVKAMKEHIDELETIYEDITDGNQARILQTWSQVK